PEGSTNPDAIARFTREAMAVVKIKSEHVCRVTDVGRLPETGAPYMVMEYLEGADLSQLLEKRGRLPVRDAVDAVIQACEAIAEAQSLGIIHRDLKPHNLFMSRRPDGSNIVKVLDFGISKLTSGRGADAVQTSTSAVIGSPLYMSPEQLASARDVDLRTDIWAIGIILFELLTDGIAFEGQTMPQLITAILTQPPKKLRELRPDAPEGLEQIILRCMEKDREKRWSTTAELVTALLPFAPARSAATVERISRVTSGKRDASADLLSSQFEEAP